MIKEVGGSGRLIFDATTCCEPYHHEMEKPVVVNLERVLREVGLTPRPIRYRGGSDANAYNAKGIPAVNIGIGAQKPHSSDEFFLIEDLHKSSEIAHRLIDIHE